MSGRAPALAILLTLCAALKAASSCTAVAQTVQSAGSPVVRVALGSGDVTIRTWNREQVQIDRDPGVTVVRSIANLPAQREVPIFAGRITAHGTQIVLPAETYVVTTVPAGQREVIALGGSGNLTLTLPEATPLLVVQVGRGRVQLSDFHIGTFIVRLRAGQAIFDDVGKDGFVQVMRGPIVFHRGALNRLRARTALGNVFFANSHVKQVEVSSVDGSLIFDNGTFENGLARFESQNGNVAIGAAGPATISAHAPEGQIYTLFDRRATVDARGGEGTLQVRGGGPLVTASSQAANVYAYDGSLRGRRLPPAWAALVTSLRRPAFTASVAPS